MKSIIIVTYNSEKYIERCLDSVYKNISDNDEVFVIDNNSQDKSINIIYSYKNNKNNLFLINNNNLGFAKAVNQGLREVKGDYIFLINPDTEFRENVLENLIILANKYNAGIAGVCQKNINNKFISSWGNFPNKFSKLIRNLKLYKFFNMGDWVDYNYLNKKLFINNRKVDWVSGGFMLIKREVINKINFFDENFFMYYEDVDYCKRATDAGFQVWYFGKIQIKHFTGASSSRRKYIDRLSKKSLDYYLKKHNLTKN